MYSSRSDTPWESNVHNKRSTLSFPGNNHRVFEQHRPSRKPCKSHSPNEYRRRTHVSPIRSPAKRSENGDQLRLRSFDESLLATTKATSKPLKVIRGTFYVAANDKFIGSVYRKVIEILLEREWTPQRNVSRSCQVILGGALGKGISWRLIGSAYGHKPLVNFYRGFRCICRKGAFVKTLREYCRNNVSRLDEFVQQSFLFYPSRMSKSEIEEFAQEFYDNSTSGNEANVWILKPTKGSKGRNIVCMDDFGKIMNFLETQRDSSDCWVVQKYIERPLLLPGQRKFDMRCWVLLNYDYSIWIYKEGVFRTCSVPFSLDDLNDPFVHLSNHCIQEAHPEYGKFEPTNEMFYEEFDSFLETSGAAAKGVTLDTCILPQVDYISVHTLLAARSAIELSGSAGYSSFNLFGFDFMIDQDYRVWLIEVNSSPAVAAELNTKLCEDLVEIAIESYVGSGLHEGALRVQSARRKSPISHQNKFEKVFPR